MYAASDSDNLEAALECNWVVVVVVLVEDAIIITGCLATDRAEKAALVPKRD